MPDRAAAEPPPGFVELPALKRHSFHDFARPWFVKDEGGVLVGGFRVMAHHCNPIGVCHGGMLATFCDVHMGLATVYQDEIGPRFVPTINLSLDYLAPAPLGAWVEARATLLRAGKRLAFVQDLLTIDGAPVVRVSGVFSLSVPDTDGEKMRQGFRKLLGVE